MVGEVEAVEASAQAALAVSLAVDMVEVAPTVVEVVETTAAVAMAVVGTVKALLLVLAAKAVMVSSLLDDFTHLILTLYQVMAVPSLAVTGAAPEDILATTRVATRVEVPRLALKVEETGDRTTIQAHELSVHARAEKDGWPS